MAAISSLIIADGQTTPVNKTFEPAKATSDYAMYEDRIGGVYIGYNKLHVSLTRPRGQSKVANRNLKVTVGLECPVLESLGTSDSGLTPPPTVAYRPQVQVTFTFPERCSRQNRVDMRALIRNALSHTAIVDAVDNLALPW